MEFDTNSVFFPFLFSAVVGAGSCAQQERTYKANLQLYLHSIYDVARVHVCWQENRFVELSWIFVSVYFCSSGTPDLTGKIDLTGDIPE